ncbi:MAG TPA: hypothetical protein VLI45_09160 [Acidobacteriaceae bacterium]|nr:hypothetical protein [Acidobacteriaceae bacterium]
MHPSVLAIIATVIVYTVFNSAAGAMLPPATGQERTRYGYWFRFIQDLASNAHRLADQRIAGLVSQLAANEEVHVSVEEHAEFSTYNGSD